MKQIKEELQLDLNAIGNFKSTNQMNHLIATTCTSCFWRENPNFTLRHVEVGLIVHEMASSRIVNSRDVPNFLLCSVSKICPVRDNFMLRHLIKTVISNYKSYVEGTGDIMLQYML